MIDAQDFFSAETTQLSLLLCWFQNRRGVPMWAAPLFQFLPALQTPSWQLLTLHCVSAALCCPPCVPAPLRDAPPRRQTAPQAIVPTSSPGVTATRATAATVTCADQERRSLLHRRGMKKRTEHTPCNARYWTPTRTQLHFHWRQFQTVFVFLWAQPVSKLLLYNYLLFIYFLFKSSLHCMLY